jgi:hypothetical protein
LSISEAQMVTLSRESWLAMADRIYLTKWCLP